jgi:uncharacterized protein
MVDFDRTLSPSGAYAGERAAIDAGLRSYMLSIYNNMSIGVALTGLFALGTYMLSVTTDPAMAAATLRDGTMLTAIGQLLFVSPLKWVVMLAPLGFAMLLGFKLPSMQASTGRMLFWAYSGLMGLSLSTIFLVYTHDSIARVFFITSAAFAGLSLYGYTTKRDLSGFASFLVMGLIGVVIASLVNLFLQSSMMQFVISCVGVIVFAGLTAWDTQRLKSEYFAYAMDGETQGRASVMGAFSLYLNFINMFTMLLQLFGQRDE